MERVDFVGKPVMVTKHAFKIQVFQKVAEAAIRDAKVEQSKHVDTAAVAYNKTQLDGAEELDQEGVHYFRSLLGKLMYIAWDRPDIQFATVTTARAGSTPSTIDLMRAKRVARYLAHRKSLWWKYEVKEFTGKIEVYTDSDWSGEPKTRRSTSGGILCFEGFVIKT